MRRATFGRRLTTKGIGHGWFFRWRNTGGSTSPAVLVLLLLGLDPRCLHRSPFRRESAPESVWITFNLSLISVSTSRALGFPGPASDKSWFDPNAPGRR